MGADAARGGKDELERRWGYSHSYGFSKLCLTQGTRALAREHPGFTVNACSPGFVRTGMTEGSSASLTPAQGAEIIVHLAVSSDEVVVRGGQLFNRECQVLSWDDAEGTYKPKE